MSKPGQSGAKKANIAKSLLYKYLEESGSSGSERVDPLLDIINRCITKNYLILPKVGHVPEGDTPKKRKTQ